MNLRTLLGSLVLVMLGLSRPCLAQFPQIFTGRGDVSSEVRGFRDGNPAADFFTYPEPFAGGVRVAVGDVNGDGIPDILTAPGPNPIGPNVKVFSGLNLAPLRDFLAYD